MKVRIGRMDHRLQRPAMRRRIAVPCSPPAAYRRDWMAASLPIGMFLLANILRLILLHGTGDRSLQMDYALIPFAYWGARKLNMSWPVQLFVGVLVAVAVISGDLLDVMSRRFNWSHGVVIDYAYSMEDLPWPAILPFVTLGAMAAGLSVLPFVVHRRVFPIWPLGVLVGALVLTNVALYGGARGDVDRSRLTQSFVAHAVRGAFNRLVVGRTLVPLSGGSMAIDMLAAPPPPQILSVAMESFGLARDPAQRALLLAPLRALAGRYTMQIGAHRFEGSTQPGEIRELCALQADGIPNTPTLLARLSAACLPARLRRRGYDTQALHGNGSLMYDRRTVYPAMGFTHAAFDADLRRVMPGTGACPGTAFGGVCDADLLPYALSLFDGSRRFIHVLTLDAHLPLSGAGHCQPAFSSDPALCRYAEITEMSLASLARAVLNAQHPPDLIVIYGDHAPPFAGLYARAQFAAHRVPYLILSRTGR